MYLQEIKKNRNQEPGVRGLEPGLYFYPVRDFILVEKG